MEKKIDNFAKEIMPSPTAPIVITEPASPSIPSIKFTAFDIATIHKTVTIYEKYPSCIGSPNGLNIESILIPSKNTIVAIATCINSLKNVKFHHLCSI